jgi:hypothetical protein
MKKRHAPEQIVRKLREADTQLAAGASIPEVGRQAAGRQRGDLPPLEEPVRRDEGRRDEAPQGA